MGVSLPTVERKEALVNPRGHAVKFYTEDGNYDLVGLNFPIFFVRDPFQSAEDGSLLADSGKEGGFGEVADVFGDNEFAKGSPSGGVDDSFLNLGSVERLKGRAVRIAI
jgi:hypothetical protein